MILNPETLIQQIVVAIIPLIFAITLHEAAHGYAASKLGDTTALMLGRVSLNPSRHIDPIGTVIIPISLMLLSGFMFGWAKPVPVNPHNLRQPRRDMALVAVAGPLANLFMAILWAGILKLTLVTAPGQYSNWAQSTLYFIQMASAFGVKINVILMLLNLLPIPPLDGSRIVSSLLPPAAAIQYEKIEPFGFWILLGLIMLNLLHYILGPLVTTTIDILTNIFNM